MHTPLLTIVPVVGHGFFASFGGKYSAPLWGAFQSHVLWAWFFTEQIVESTKPE